MALFVFVTGFFPGLVFVLNVIACKSKSFVCICLCTCLCMCIVCNCVCVCMHANVLVCVCAYVCMFVVYRNLPKEKNFLCGFLKICLNDYVFFMCSIHEMNVYQQILFYS